MDASYAGKEVGMKTDFPRLWGVPLLLGVITAAGLLAGLFGDGVWDVFSAIALGIPILAAGWNAGRRQPRR